MLITRDVSLSDPTRPFAADGGGQALCDAMCDAHLAHSRTARNSYPVPRPELDRSHFTPYTDSAVDAQQSTQSTHVRFRSS